MEYQINQAINVLKSLANIPEEEIAVEKFVSEVRQVYKDDKKGILQSIIGATYDGLKFGNWPWTRHEVVEK